MNDQWLARPFPMPTSPELRAAYNDLYLAANGDEATKKRIGNPMGLPRPWDPPTCTRRELRAELWEWLDAVASWFNHEFVWDLGAGGFIPACWPLHPHLVHEVALLADQRRRAAVDTTSASLEEWHRYTVPAFVERLRARTRTLCDEGHKPWPARSRYDRYTSSTATDLRNEAYAADVAPLYSSPQPQRVSGAPASTAPPSRGLLRLVDADSGRPIDATTGEVQ